MIEPIDPALYDMNVEAELATFSTEPQRKELDNLHALPSSKRMKLSSSSASTSKASACICTSVNNGKIEKECYSY